MVDVQIGKETPTKGDTGGGHGTRAEGLGAGHLELETR